MWTNLFSKNTAFLELRLEKSKQEMKHEVAVLCTKLDDKFLEQFGFRIRETTLQKIVSYMFVPKDASSLAFTRIVFGIAMFFDVPDERGGANLETRWGAPDTCHFPLLPFLVHMALPQMALVYLVLWLATLGIALGYKYRYSCVAFIVCYWYLILIEKSLWNNHTYLFGLVSILLAFTEADCYWSLDVYMDPSKKKETVPYWNYYILKYQFFILYFMAGVKKFSKEWLAAYSVSEICNHWVFDIFKMFLTSHQINKYIVHWFISVFDLTIAMWMMWARSRNIAVLFCSLFHFMNMRIFTIGMFPWLCLGTIPLFYSFDWPKRILGKLCKLTDNFKERYLHVVSCCCNRLKKGKNVMDEKSVDPDATNETDELAKEYSSLGKELPPKVDNNKQKGTKPIRQINCKTGKYQEKKEGDKNNTATELKNKMIALLIFLYMLWQAFMPFSHFITKGYNTWTDGLYGYSWDMMVHDWYQAAITVRVVDNEMNSEFFYDHNNTTLTPRWTHHGDMVYQYAHCVRDTIQKHNNIAKQFNGRLVSDNISIYIDVWNSINLRFHQRMYDPNVDMLNVQWSPFQRPSFVIPLLEEASDRRDELIQITERIMAMSNDTDVMFFVHFPGYTYERFVTPDLKDVVLTILSGTAIFITDDTSEHNGQSYKLTDGEAVDVAVDAFHKVINIGDEPVYFMYTERCTNCKHEPAETKDKPKLPIFQEFINTLHKIWICARVLIKNLLVGCEKCKKYELHV